MGRIGAVAAVSAALIVAAVSVLTALALGTEAVALTRLVRILRGAEHGMYADIVLGLRMPRALAAFGSGGLLALAGALMQIMLRNPLADPYILGLAGGAGTGALVAMVLGTGDHGILGASWAGAIVSVILVITLGQRSFSGRDTLGDADEPLRLLLIGVALAIAWAAFITLILALAPDASLRGMLFWLMGNLDGAEDYLPSIVGLAILTSLAVAIARDLNLVSLGSSRAHALGVSPGRLRLIVLLLASAATALAVTTVGTVGFLGLLVPNAVRLLTGNDQRILLPVSALAGGALLTGADTIARSAVAPLQLPVGAVVALVGVPAFVALLSQKAVRR